MNNTTLTYLGKIEQLTYAPVSIVQFMLVIFLYVDSLLIFIFFQKDYFWTRMCYIFFIQTILCDWLYLCFSNILLIMSFFGAPMLVGMCFMMVILLSLLTFSTPLTMVAMCIERYVAICLPLRHSEIATVRRALYCIFIIHGLSSIQIFTIASVFVASVPLSFYATYKVCQVEMLIIHKWQGYLRPAISLFYFLIMSCIILFTYIKIVGAAKKAASDKKTSASKAHNTVILHSIQLVLCMLQFLTPFIETSVLEMGIYVYVIVRYFDYICFTLAPRCLCPLVYGLRDEKFFMALKYYALFGLRKKVKPHF